MKHSQLMIDLKLKLNELLEWLVPNEEVIFVDMPVYLNIGDLIIHQGTEDFFNENNINVIMRTSDKNFDIDYIVKNHSNTTVICQGGGNFGDTYTTHQNVRDKLIKFHQGKVIILPQSINFESTDNLNKCVELYKTKTNLYMCARDEYSKDVMQKMCKNVKLLPDMAHYSWNDSTYAKGEGLLEFIRKDNEASEDNSRYLTANSKDWIDDFTIFDRAVLKVAQLVLPRCKTKLKANLFSKIWLKYCSYKLKRTKNMFLNYERVITSRLHGHILSCLLSLPNEVIDNSYKKNSRYVTSWTLKSDLVKSK